MILDIAYSKEYIDFLYSPEGRFYQQRPIYWQKAKLAIHLFNFKN